MIEPVRWLVCTPPSGPPPLSLPATHRAQNAGKSTDRQERGHVPRATREGRHAGAAQDRELKTHDRDHRLALGGAETRSWPRPRVEQLAHRRVERGWVAALDRANLAEPQPVIHDLRHTHVSGLIADGWDPLEVARRIGDTLATTLKVYSHEFDSRRRSEARRDALEARYGAVDGNQMATQGPQQSATEQPTAIGDVADLQAIRNRPR